MTMNTLVSVDHNITVDIDENEEIYLSILSHGNWHYAHLTELQAITVAEGLLSWLRVRVAQGMSARESRDGEAGSGRKAASPVPSGMRPTSTRKEDHP
jgi:hypothetical protein